MKNLFYFLTALILAVIAFASCTDENTSPEILSNNLTDTTIHVGSQLLLEAKIKSDLVFEYQWILNNELKSSEAVYIFTPENSGEYKIKVIVGNKFGKDSIESIIKVLPRILKIDFEDLQLGSNNYWNGSDGSGGYMSGMAKFNNFYDAEYMYWENCSYSNMHDTETAGYGNQYSVYSNENGDNKFTVFYSVMQNNPAIEFTNNEVFEVQTLDICNTTYTALSMKNGDMFTKKFGGDSGSDNDFFKITVNGLDASSNVVSSVDIYLADFRFINNAEDFIVDSWKSYDISSLGAVNKISFTFDSSDKGDWGINTPCYFCFDNLTYFEKEE